MNKQEKKLLLEIYRDCLKLKRKGDLTEFGKGQMALCKIFNEKA